MRRLLAALAVASVVACATVAYATRLDLTPAYLAAGGADVTSCDHDGVEVHYQLAWKGYFAIAKAAVSGIDDDCVGLHLMLVLVVGDDAVEPGSVVVPATAHDDNAVTITVPGDVPALDVGDVHVAIT
jgi:hypothetical protein